MAMPDLIQSVANSFLELTPGTSANPTNLKTLLAWILQRDWTKASDEMYVVIQTVGTKKKPELFVVLDDFRFENASTPSAPISFIKSSVVSNVFFLRRPLRLGAGGSTLGIESLSLCRTL